MQAAQARRAAVSRSSGAGIAAKPGYPTVIVPYGQVPNQPTPPLPDGFDALPSPYGVSFTGTACSEPRLIELAYAFEQATKKRVPRHSSRDMEAVSPDAHLRTSNLTPSHDFA
jgi:Asp-tRNA(Asn)/Glu-tRNA(Gln) amidotransferase A subunit family amidase